MKYFLVELKRTSGSYSLLLPMPQKKQQHLYICLEVTSDLQMQNKAPEPDNEALYHHKRSSSKRLYLTMKRFITIKKQQ